MPKPDLRLALYPAFRYRYILGYLYATPTGFLIISLCVEFFRHRRFMFPISYFLFPISYSTLNFLLFYIFRSNKFTFASFLFLRSMITNSSNNKNNAKPTKY